MVRRTSARRYAQAIFEIALEKKELRRWHSDLETIREVLKDEQLSALLPNPKLRFTEKMRLLEELLPGLNSQTRNFLALLVTKNNVEVFHNIAAEYDKLLDAHYGVGHIEVTTAVSLEQDEQQQLQEHLGALTGRKIVLTNKVDPAIIGGMVARVEDKLIDGSIRTKLQELKESIATRG